tara:strand:- start:1001 stop:1216 length:216 start_codon:yes stop_codon:yes gene_type:complete
MTTIDFVEIELGGEKWKITWDTKTRKKIKTRGEKAGLMYTIYSLTELTPAQAYDIAMTQLEWLKKDQVYVI